MAGYVIADVEVTDPEKFEVYRGQVGATIEQYGGRYIVRGGETETAEGAWNPRRLVVIEFETLARAREWYYSPEYAAPMKLRHESANTNVVFAEGL